MKNWIRKNKLFLVLTSTAFFAPVALAASCGSFEKKLSTEDKQREATWKKEIASLKSYYESFKNFWDDKYDNGSLNSLKNFGFYYKNIMDKVTALSKALQKVHTKINDEEFEGKEQILQRFFTETDLSENVIKTYIDAYNRFSQINSHFEALKNQRSFEGAPGTSNKYREYYDRIFIEGNSELVFDREFDDLFTNKSVQDLLDSYNSFWYDKELREIDYAALAEKIQVDASGENKVIAHKEAIGNIIKEWATVVAQNDSVANQKIKEFIDYLKNSELQNNAEFHTLIVNIEDLYSQFLESVNSVTSQFGNKYPYEKILNSFNENSDLVKFNDKFKEIKDLYQSWKN
ncbi:hypothetical protein VO56_00630 [Mycoplasmopsis gallinacea]|uniref:Lipoprotein n=1 Tax=Mycoplasmopsis gallinacea TaxID=29556 RepID=A0A0D5ZJB4_9BACT|nr:hypothetical protein VO56_00630 [Mycoplasmopsis gallinacea]